MGLRGKPGRFLSASNEEGNGCNLGNFGNFRNFGTTPPADDCPLLKLPPTEPDG